MVFSVSIQQSWLSYRPPAFQAPLQKLTCVIGLEKTLELICTYKKWIEMKKQSTNTIAPIINHPHVYLATKLNFWGSTKCRTYELDLPPEWHFWKTRDSQPKASCHLSLGFQGWARVDPTSPSSWYARSTISLAESEGLVLSVQKFGAASVGSFWWLQIHRSGTCNVLWKTYHGKGNVSFIFKGLCPNISNISEA